MKQAKQAFSKQASLCALGRGGMALALWLVLIANFIQPIVTAQAAPVIGAATTVVRDVQGLLEQNWRVVVIDDSVHQDELILPALEVQPV